MSFVLATTASHAQDANASAAPPPATVFDEQLISLQQELLEAGPLAASPETLRSWVDARLAAPRPEPQRPAEEGEEAQDNGLDYLLQATYLNFQADGSLEVVDWQILRPRSRDAVTYSSQVVADWAPWRMTKPLLSARVLTPNDRLIENDGQGAFEQSASDGVTTLTDSRRLTLLLDSVEQDAVVETKSVYVYQPLFEQSIGQRCMLTAVQPARTYRLFVQSAGETPLHYSLFGEGIEDVTPAEDSRWKRVLAVEDPVSLLSNFELACGPDLASYPMVYVCRPGDWQAIGKGYAEMVEGAITEGASVVESIVQASSSEVSGSQPTEKVEWCLKRVRQLLRYTGVEFGAQRVFPVAPNVAIQRRFGDCKDQSTLLVALLRELGIKAHVALLNAGSAVDVPLEGKAADFFNHAIVYVESLDLWIDPAADPYPVGLLPSSACGRRALICDQSNSRMVTTPVGDSQHSTREEIYAYRINFSGGGDLFIRQITTGEEGISLASTFQEQPQQMKQYWAQFFEQYTGEKNKLELRHGSFGDTGYAVFARSSAMQLVDRSAFRMNVTWDLRDVLAELPGALSAYIDSEVGQWKAMEPRRNPLAIRTGTTVTRELQVWFPGGLELSEVPEAWEKKIGPLSFSLTVTESAADDVAMQLPEVEWQSLAATAPQLDEAWLKAHDRLLRLRFQIIVEPASIAAEEANAIIDEIGALLVESDRCFGDVTLTWRTAEGLQPVITNEVISELAEQAHRYRPLHDPTVALASILQRSKFQEQVVKIIPDFEKYNPSFSISSNLYMQLLLETNLWGYAPWADFPKAVEYYRDHIPMLAEGSHWTWLTSLALDEYGLLSDDPAVQRQVIKTGKELLQLPGSTAMSQSSVSERIMTAALALKDEREFENALRYSAPSIRRIFGGLSTARKDNLAEYPPESRQRLLASLWELLLVAGRHDLANPFLEIYGKDAGINFQPVPLERTRLAELDESDPISVARHQTLAYCSYDMERLKQLSFGELPSLRTMQEANASRFSNSWFVIQHVNRSRALYETVCANVRATARTISPLLVFVEFEGPYDWANQLPGGAKVISSKKLVRLEESAPWRVEDADSFDRWLALFAAGKHDEVTKELEDTLPKAPGLFGLFAQQPLPPHEQLWHRIEKDAPYRAELVVRAWAAAVRGDANLLDEWLATQQIDFTSPQAKSLEDVRLSCWVKQRDFARAAVMLLDRTSETIPLGDLERLGEVLEFDKQMGGVLWKEARFAEAIAQRLSDSKLTPRTRAWWLFLQGEDEAAFDVLENAISEPGELAKAELEKLANMYLWRRMMSSTDPQVLLQAYDLVRSKLTEQSGENMYLAHTLACAEAQIGKLKEALGYVAIYGTPEASNELVRGLVLQRLGFDALAQELFQRVIAINPMDSNAVIARLHLRADPANESKPANEQDPARKQGAGEE